MRKIWEARQAVKMTPNLVIPLEQSDAEKAKDMADREGVDFQDFARKLFHEALVKREQAA